MTILWFIVWLIANDVGGREPLLFDPVNAWTATLILAIGLGLGASHARVRSRCAVTRNPIGNRQRWQGGRLSRILLANCCLPSATETDTGASPLGSRKTTDAWPSPQGDDRSRSPAPARVGFQRTKDVAMASTQHEKHRLVPDDQKLVDLLGDVVVDPNLHTDTRLRLYQEIAEILRGAQVDLHGPAGDQVHARALEAHDGRLPDLLATVLVDPNLHTDTRMRLHEQIAQILDSASASVPR